MKTSFGKLWSNNCFKQELSMDAKRSERMMRKYSYNENIYTVSKYLPIIIHYKEGINSHLMVENLADTNLTRWSELVSPIRREHKYLLTWCTEYTWFWLCCYFCKKCVSEFKNVRLKFNWEIIYKITGQNSSKILAYQD